jgi:hypothetical protein
MGKGRRMAGNAGRDGLIGASRWQEVPTISTSYFVIFMDKEYRLT